MVTLGNNDIHRVNTVYLVDKVGLRGSRAVGLVGRRAVEQMHHGQC